MIRHSLSNPSPGTALLWPTQPSTPPDVRTQRAVPGVSSLHQRCDGLSRCGRQRNGAIPSRPMKGSKRVTIPAFACRTQRCRFESGLVRLRWRKRSGEGSCWPTAPSRAVRSPLATASGWSTASSLHQRRGELDVSRRHATVRAWQNRHRHIGYGHGKQRLLLLVDIVHIAARQTGACFRLTTSEEVDQKNGVMHATRARLRNTWKSRKSRTSNDYKFSVPIVIGVKDTMLLKPVNGISRWCTSGVAKMTRKERVQQRGLAANDYTKEARSRGRTGLVHLRRARVGNTFGQGGLRLSGSATRGSLQPNSARNAVSVRCPPHPSLSPPRVRARPAGQSGCRLSRPAGGRLR